MIITIDGLSATGKTTVAKRVAQELGWLYFDSGAMYRAITYSLLKKKISLKDRAKLKDFLTSFHFDIRSNHSKVSYYVGDENVTDQIRSPEVNSYVSEVSADPAVREYLLPLQRAFGKDKKVVFEGRDMGTTVFPEADLKIFLTARSSVRAERRYLELQSKYPNSSEQKIMENLLSRDNQDSTRALSPLKQAENAHHIDTSDVTIDEVVAQILALVSNKG